MPLKLDKMVLVDSQNQPIAFFLGNKENYPQGVTLGVREYAATDGPFMPTRRHEIEGSGHAIRVQVSGGGKATKIMVRADLLSSALGSSSGLLNKQIKVGNTTITIQNVSVPRRTALA